MKNVFMMRKKKDAVSPVIATILMVAITVVLAAVLYVMVMGFGGSSGQTPTGTLQATKNSTEANGTAYYTIQVLSISKNDVLRTDCALVFTPAVSGAPTVLTASLVGSTHVTANDYAYVYLAPGTYTVALLYKTTNNNIASTTIIVPPAA